MDARSISRHQRVELAPDYLAGVMRQRRGTVVKVGRKWIHVRMDGMDRTLRFDAANLRPVR